MYVGTLCNKGVLLMWEKWNQMKLIDIYHDLTSEEINKENCDYCRIGIFMFKVRDYVHAVEFFEKAIENNKDVDVLFYLGLCCKYGLGVQRTDEKADELFSRWISAAGKMRNHIWDAFCMLGGYGQIQDVDRALRILKRGANSRNSECCRILAYFYMGHMVDGQKNQEAAREYLEIASDENDVDAAYELSYVYKLMNGGRYVVEAQAAYAYVTGQYMRVKEKYPSADAYRHLMEHYRRGCVGINQDHYDMLADECQAWLDKNQ